MTHKKTVLHIIARMNIGGTSRYLETLLPELPKNGFEYLLAVGYTQGEELESGGLSEVKFRRIPSMGRSVSPVRDFFAYLELRKLVKDLKPDLIHTHTFKAGLLGRLLSTKIPKIHTFHGHLFKDPMFKGFSAEMIRMIEKTLARKSEVLITVGDNVAVDLLSQNIGKRRQYRSIPPGIKPLDIPEKNQAERNLGLTQDSAMTIGWLARMTSVKNPQLMLEIAKMMPTCRFLMAGGGDLFEEIKSKAPDNTKVLGWVNPADLIGASNVMVSTSHNEGIPISLIESQMAGIPTVATDVGSVSEVVINEETGFLTGESRNEMVEKLNILVSNPQVLSRMSEISMAHSREKFSVDEMVQRHVDIYQLAIGKNQ
jgi:glycosyltransferase involved in cell wall biosynthesis